MPAPSSSLATLRPDLVDSFMEFDLEMEKQGYIALNVFPVIEVGLQSDNPGKIPIEQLLQIGETARNSGGGYNRGSWKFETFSYATREHGWEEPVDDRDAKRYRHFFNAEQIAAARAYGFVTRNQEQRAAAALFNASTWTGASLTTAVTNEWDDAANATPITDVEAAVRLVYAGSGLWPNALVINRKVFRNLRNCDSVIDRINSAGAGSPSKPEDVTAAMLSAVFDLPHIIIGGGSKNSANEGQAASVAQVWSDEYAMVCRVAETNDIREPCVGRTFHWSEDGSNIGGTIETYRDEVVRSDIVRVRHETDEVVMYAAAGHLLSNITT